MGYSNTIIQNLFFIFLFLSFSYPGCRLARALLRVQTTAYPESGATKCRSAFPFFPKENIPPPGLCGGEKGAILSPSNKNTSSLHRRADAGRQRHPPSFYVSSTAITLRISSQLRPILSSSGDSRSASSAQKRALFRSPRCHQPTEARSHGREPHASASQT